MFDGQKGVAIRQVIDGTSNTLLVAEVANSQTLWTEPRDLDLESMPRDFQSSNQTECMSGLRAGTVMIATADGAAYYLDTNMLPESLQQLLIRNDREPFDRSDLIFIE